jgi:hypothetical protein
MFSLTAQRLPPFDFNARDTLVRPAKTRYIRREWAYRSDEDLRNERLSEGSNRK